MRFNIFKKQKGDQPSPAARPETKEKTVASSEVKDTLELGGNDFSYVQIASPYLTEKTSLLNSGGQYVFKVFSRAGKVEIKKAVEQLYGVHVEKVRVMTAPGKTRKLGRLEGEKSGFKKAMVRLRKGEKIEIAAH